MCTDRFNAISPTLHLFKRFFAVLRFNYRRLNQLRMKLLNFAAPFKASAFVNSSSEPENGGLGRSNTGSDFFVGKPLGVNFAE